MLNAQSSSPAPEWFASYQTNLPLLLHTLRNAGWPIGTDTLLNVKQLLLRLQAMAQLPATPVQLSAYLQPLLCSSAEQQQEFASLYHGWCNLWYGQANTERADSPQTNLLQENTPSVDEHLVIKKRGSSPLFDFSDEQKQRWSRGIAAGLLSVFILLVGVYLGLPTRETTIPDSYTRSKQSAPEFSDDEKQQNDALNIPIQPVPLRRDVELPGLQPLNLSPLNLSPEAEQQLALYQQLFRWLPVAIISALFVIYYLRRRYYLNKHKADKNSPLQYLAATRHRLQPFAWLNLSGALAKGGVAPTRRYHIPKTVQASLRQGGLFKPIFAMKKRKVTLLVLVDRRHRDDMQSDLASLLVTQLRAEGLQVEDYEFNRDPRFLVSREWVSREQNASGKRQRLLPLQRVLNWHRESHVVLVGDGHALFHPFKGELFTWSKQAFGAMRHKMLLSTTHQPWGSAEVALSRQLGFHIAPFSSEGMQVLSSFMLKQHAQLAASLEPTHSGVNQSGLWFLQGASNAFYLPPLIRANYDQWLSSAPPSDYDFEQLLQELLFYYRRDGVELIAACALYPEVLPKLTHILNTQLFVNETARKKEQRLLRLNPLPWFRFGYLPDYLRKDLINWFPEDRLKQVVNGFEAIFKQLSPTANPNAALAGFARAQEKPAFNLRRWLRYMPEHTHWADRIFVDTLLQFRPARWQWFVPAKLAKLLRGGTSRPRIYRKYWAISSAMLLALAGWFSGNALWNGVVKGYSEAQLLAQMQQQASKESGQVQVQVFTTGSTQQATENKSTQHMAQTISAQLHALGYDVTTGVNGDAQPASGNLLQQNTLIYTSQHQAAAAHIAQVTQRLAYNGLNWQLQLTESPNNPAQNNTIQLHLRMPPATGSVFSDALTHPLPPGFSVDLPTATARTDTTNNDAPESVTETEQAGSVPEPTMVLIPAGEFLMGSTQQEVEQRLADQDETPQHKVNIQAFYMSATEVTFAQYAAFANATGREMPDDEGWGQGERPVMNVSWRDATAYTQWLSQQTGKAYRLPSEAEWEYAARAGTTTAFSTGECLDGNQANINDRYSFGDCKKNDIYLQQTAPVASYPPNAFGLYDMHGNVREWTADCWHSNYNNAPTDGSAWLAAEAESDGTSSKACERYSVRGGSRDYFPQFARSANRYRFNLNGTYNSVGFRVARTN